MKYKIIIFLLTTCFVSCHDSPIKSDLKIKYIKAYYRPLFITIHGSSIASDMRTGKSFHINKENKKDKRTIIKTHANRKRFFRNRN